MAADALLEATPHVPLTTAQLERMGELLDGDVQENDPSARGSLTEATFLASLGPDDALALLYEMTNYRPKAKPDQLFGAEKGTLLRQLGLFKRELDRGKVGRATAIAHLDNVAERIVRASSRDLQFACGREGRHRAREAGDAVVAALRIAHQRCRVDIDIVPAEREQLPLAESRGQRRDPERPESVIHHTHGRPLPDRDPLVSSRARAREV